MIFECFMYFCAQIIVMASQIPQIEQLHVRNYRALADIKLDKITPLTVFLGANGSGKSTLFDVFAFLSECFTVGLRKAWEKRGRFKELRTRDKSGPIFFEIKYREQSGQPLITYHLEIEENIDGPFVAKEWLQWKRTSKSRPFLFLNFEHGVGTVVSGEMPDEDDVRMSESLASQDMIAVNTLGQLSKHPRVTALRAFISSWYLSYITADNTRGIPEAGAQERLSSMGDNLPNVIQHLLERHPDRLNFIMRKMQLRIPRLESAYATRLADGRLMLQIKDAPFAQPILSKFASDGTLKMLAYLTVLFDPHPPFLIGIEEPENQLHPRLLLELAEECKSATEGSQIFITTHSPFFINALEPNEVWALYRDEKGYTQAKRASDMKGVMAMYDNEQLKLGTLWADGHFDYGNP
jgi:predicted ATPase